jgi:hypothetical protein
LLGPLRFETLGVIQGVFNREKTLEKKSLKLLIGIEDSCKRTVGQQQQHEEASISHCSKTHFSVRAESSKPTAAQRAVFLVARPAVPPCIQTPT